MSDPKQVCDDCGNKMTLILTSFKCDWCDGLVADEWDKVAHTTEPGGYNFTNFKYLGKTEELYDDQGYFDLSDIDLNDNQD